MSKITPEQAIEQIARQHGEPPEQVRSQIQKAIDEAYDNAKDDLTRFRQKQIPCKGERPTPEEFISFVVNRLND